MLLLCCPQPKHVGQIGTKRAVHSGTGLMTSFETRVRSKEDAAFEKMLDPIEGSPATGKSIAEIINLYVDDLIGTGGTEMEQRVLTRLRKISKLVQKIGIMYSSQDKEFVGRRILNWDQVLRLAKKGRLNNCRRSQSKRTRRKISTVHLQCIPRYRSFLSQNKLIAK